MSYKIKILIADDHCIVRDGLRQHINAQEDMELIGEAQDGREALKKARSLRPDVTLIDIAMPHLSGLDAVRLIKEAVPESEIVVLSMHAREAYVYQMLVFGALGYVLKTSPSSEVLEAIRAARRKEYFLSSTLRAEVISVYLKNHRKNHFARGYDLLSRREQQIFQLVVEGKTTKQIADILCVGSKTVEKYRSAVSKKLGIHSLVEMVRYAVKIGIINPEL
jgi:two-component system response regulator NreC